MRLLVDTNVILDVLLARSPLVGAAAAILDLVADKTLDGLVSATTVTTIHYVATKAVGRTQARRHLRTLLDLLEVAPVTRAVLADALELEFADFEDAVLHEAARHAGALGIVTRDPKGFARARLKVYVPDEVVKFIRASGSG